MWHSGGPCELRPALKLGLKFVYLTFTYYNWELQRADGNYF